MDFDLVVVGAGTGGTTAARFAGRAGLKVCLLDTKPRDKVGVKVCGDAVGGEIFDILGIDPPKNEDLSWKVKGAKLVSPDRQTSITMVDPSQAGYIVNRHEFGQRLLNEALGAGSVEFRERTFAKELIVEGGLVKGVKVRDKSKSGTDEIRAKVTIDASGYHTPLRKGLNTPFIERDIDEETDSIICYREIVDLGTPGDFDPDYIVITLDQELAPGGYLWHFPRSQTAINIGIGTYLRYTRELKKWYFQNAFQPFVKEKKFTVTARGGGLVTVRRPIASAVEDGVMFVGDAAAQVNPLDGGGIDSSMRAGAIAGKTAVAAIQANNLTKAGLWNYNVEFMRSLGAQFGSLDVLRVGLQSLSNQELNFGLKNQLLESKDILDIAAKGRAELGLLDMVTRAVRGIRKPGLLATLAFIHRKMGEMKDLYKQYPENPQSFLTWKEKMLQRLGGTRKVLAPQQNLFTYTATQKKRQNPAFWVV